MPLFSEQEIIAGCKKQNRSLQEYLYQQQYSTLLKVCARYAKNMSDAEQLLNDGFLKIFTAIDKYNNTGSFVGWMKKIMVNTCLDYLRSNYLKEELSIHVNAVSTDQADIPVNHDMIETIEFKELLKMIQGLPAMTRTVFNLAVFEGFSHKEIAVQLAISESTSSWHLHQARHQLQKKIKFTDQNKVIYEAKRI
jgi:RNA polymerase sigma-70 factor (ECF subfamily)